jgi:hypothetical protein
MSEHADGDRRKQIAGVLLALAGLVLPLFAERALPDLTTAQAQSGLAASLAGAAFGVILILTTFWKPRAQEKSRKPRRQWSTVGFGQGWIEHRVRNDEGAELVVSANPGAGGDQIHLEISFPTRSRLRTSERVELVLEIDERPFELFVDDGGTTRFLLRTQVWRDLETFREIVAALRRGEHVWATIPELDLATKFTLEGAYDVLAEVETMDSTDA